MLYYEERGIKTRIISWQDDLLDLIFSDSFTNNKFIKMEYNDKIVTKYSKDKNYKVGMDILYKGLYYIINHIIDFNDIKISFSKLN